MHRRTAAVVHIADNLAIKNGCSPILSDGFEDKLDEAAMSAIGLTRTQLAAIEKKMDKVIPSVQDICR